MYQTYLKKANKQTKKNGEFSFQLEPGDLTKKHFCFHTKFLILIDNHLHPPNLFSQEKIINDKKYLWKLALVSVIRSVNLTWIDVPNH